MSGNNLTMSPQQKAIWEMIKKYEGSCLGNIGGIMYLKKDTKEDLIYRSICRTQYLNPALRLCVNPEGGLYLNVSDAVEFQVIDGSLLSEEQMEKLIQEKMDTPIFQTNSILVKYYFIKRKEDACLLGIYHHLICDGMSLQLIIREIYALIHDKKSCLWEKEAIPDMRYLEYLQMIPDAKTTKRNETALQWYTKKCTQENMVFANRREGYTGKAKVYQKIISGSFYQYLQKAGEEQTLTVEQLLEGALARYYTNITGYGKISMGRVLMNRRKNHVDAVGMYANTLPFVIDVDEKESFVEMCRKIKQAQFTMLKYSAVSVEEIRKKNKLSGKLYDICVSYRTAKRLPGNRKEGIKEVDCSAVEIPLKIVMDEYEKEIHLTYKYMTEVYTQEEICALDACLEQIIRMGLNGAKNSDIKFGLQQKNYISFQEQQLLQKQKSSSGYSKKIPDIIDVFSKKVKEHPDRLLWIDLSVAEIKKITYIEAANIVERLAAQMWRSLKTLKKEKGNQPVIGLYLKRTYRMPAAMLAALKIGAVFYPINIEESEIRQKEIRKQVSYMVTDLQMDDWLTEKKNDDKIEISENTTAESIAYWINTSGSTGNPKLVQIYRKALNLRLQWMIETFSMEQCRVLQKTKNTFDVSVWELLLPVMAGGSLVLIPDGQERNPEFIARIVCEYKVDTIHFVPSMLAVFLSWIKQKEYADQWNVILKNVIVSGEQLPSALVRRWMKQFPKVRIFNLYGPAECTIDVSYHLCSYDEEPTPIGMPVWGTQLKIVNKCNQEVPFGYVGQIAILGELVGKGYVNNQIENDKRFVQIEGEKGYLTGDLAYVGEKGELIYVGRMDREIKHRGMRIHLTVLEKEVCAVEQIRSAAAVVEQGHLLLFVETDDTKEQLRKKLAEHLAPHYMPDILVPIKEMPFNSNGKCDYKQLSQKYQECFAKIDEKTEEKMSNLEKTVLACVKKITGTEVISRDDNIFEYGMDSLLVVELILELERCGYHVHYDDIYREGTVRKIARLMENTKIKCKKDASILYSFFAQDEEQKEKQKIVIAIPYAGTSVHIFDTLAKDLKIRGIRFFACDIQNQQQSVEKLAEQIEQEILSLLMPVQTELTLLGCCVGAALALELGKRMKNYPQVKCRIIFAGSLPTYYCKGGKQKIVWDILPKKMGEWMLSRIYGKEIRLTAEMYDRLRREARIYIAYFEKNKKKKERVALDAILIFGDHDLLTRGYRKQYRQWERYLSGSVRIMEIKGAKHFFFGKHMEKIRNILLDEKRG